MPAKKNQVVLGETTYNFSISSARVWFEDDESKHQWEWKNEEAPESKPVTNQVPSEMFLTAAKKACENGGRTSECVVTVEAAKTPGDLALCVEAKITCGDMQLSMARVFVLEAVPLTSEQIWGAKYADFRGRIQDLEQHVADGNAKIASLQEEANKTLWQKLCEWVRRVVSTSIDYGDKAWAAAKNAASEAQELLHKLVQFVGEWMAGCRAAGTQKAM